MQLELEPGRNAEVAAAAADRPEKIRMGFGIHAEAFSISGYNIGGEQRVDGEAVLADETSHTATQRDPTNPDRACIAESGRKTMGTRGSRVLSRSQSCLGPRGALFGIDVQSPHSRKIEHDPTVRDAMAGDAVTTAANGELQPGLVRERDDMRHISRVCDPNDDRWPAIDPAVEDGACFVVPSIVRRDHPAVEGGAELWDREYL